ncbi:MAG: hypothetical protein Q8L51_03950 [Candidatus Amesbacteria bacterium]|nr:hypothetical protein [Candidatus Amesbacteria bacterium]
MSKSLIFIVLALMVGAGVGYFVGVSRGAVSAPKTAVVVPSPSPKVVAEEKFENIKADVKFADGKKFTYTQDGKDKTLTDLTGITVWKSTKEGEKPSKMDWSAVKAGMNVQLASEKATGKIVAVLVL